MKHKKTLLFTLIFLFVIGAFLSCQAQPVVGREAKDIRLPGVNADSISLSSLKGRIVLIDFWASWCRPCRQTIPALKKLYETYHTKGLEIYGVSLDDDKNAWREAIMQDQSSWIHVNDNTGVVANEWFVSEIPSTFLLNKNGKIIAVDEEPKTLNRLLAKLFK